MTDDLTVTERNKYSKMWALPKYRERSPGMRFIDEGLMSLAPEPGATFIDLGCGTGRVANHLDRLGFKVTAVDIAPNACTEFMGPFIQSCLWELPTPATRWEYGYCADVLEHIPTERVPDTLRAIAAATDAVYFQIANFVCHEGDEIGEALHLTVKPTAWWEAELRKHWAHVQVTKAPKHHLCVCRHE